MKTIAIVSAIALATVLMALHKVKKLKEGIARSRREIEDGENRIKWP